MSNFAIIENTNYPEDLCCPISHDLMVDPVLINDGHTYEKENIIRWLKTNNKSPLTNEIVKFNYHEPDKFIKSNILVKKFIIKWKEDNIIKKEFYLENNCYKFKETDDLITSDYIKLIHKNFTYEGAISDGEFSDKGILKKNNGNIYEGEFLNNKKHGKGKITFKTGEIYDGNWFENIINGIGKMIFKNGDIYDGNWDGRINNGDTFLNLINGFGKMIYKNGDVYNGYWKNGKKKGKGTMRYKDGSIYEGEWSEDFRNGKGKMTYFNRQRHYYDGDWNKDKRHGKGIYYDGNYNYDGKWSEDLKHGEGILQSNGDRYYGKWINNKMQGIFTIKYSNDDKYNGEVNSYGERHGNGNLKYSKYRKNNSFEEKYDYYEGQWENNIKKGKGFMKFKNGDKYNGEWSNNLRNGQGELKKYGKWDNYVGEWSEGWKKSSGIWNPYTYFNGTYNGSL